MIEIHLDGKPVTKLQAARALADAGGERAHVYIGVPGKKGWLDDSVAVYGSQRDAFGNVHPPQLGCFSFHADTVAEMRQQAETITLAAEVAELAEMLAAEQDADGPASTEAAAFDNGMHFTESLCPSGLGLIGGGILPCHLEAGHNGPHSLIDATEQWAGAGNDARTIDATTGPLIAEHRMRRALGYDRQAHLTWHEQAYPGRPEYPAEPRTEAATLAAIAAYSAPSTTLAD